MTLAATPVQFVARPMPAMAFGAQDFCPNFLPKSAGIFGRVRMLTVSPLRNRAGGLSMKKRRACRLSNILRRKAALPCDVIKTPSAPPRDGLHAARFHVFARPTSPAVAFPSQGILPAAGVFSYPRAGGYQRTSL